MRSGKTIRVVAIIRTKSIGSIRVFCPSGVPSTGTKRIDRHAFGMRIESSQYLQHGGAVRDGFAHADDAAAAHLEPGRADGPQGREPVLISACRHDVWVEFGACIEIVIIGRQPRLFQPLRLVLVQHAERHAGLEP